MKKLAIIGRGTAGCLSMIHFLRWTDWQIDWYYDENIKPQAVGEGSQLIFPIVLEDCLGMHHSDISKIDGTVKLGIHKIGYGNNSNFYHDFNNGSGISYHFNATKLQNFIFDEVKNNQRVTCISENINHNNIDSDFIMDCGGKPSNYDDFHLSEYIPVNAVYVTQCYWDYPRYQHTLAIARPYGWVFGIPLQNRCSIGYMYNHQINNIENVKEDVKEIFKQFNLTPSDNTNSFHFNNYYRKQNYSDDGRIAYNGNASFFLEPMEATSITRMDNINRVSWDIWNKGGKHVAHSANKNYSYFFSALEKELMIHYYAGSPYKTKFWEFSKNRGEIAIKNLLKYPEFQKILNICEKDIKENGLKHTYIPGKECDPIVFATWSVYSWKTHIYNFGILDRLLELKRQV